MSLIPGANGKGARALLGVLLLLISVPWEAAAAAPEPAFDLPPQIKVEVGAHTGFIKKLAVSVDGASLLSVSDDRTARLWDARTGRMLRTLRVPLGIEGEGKLSAAAFTRDGRFAVVGGFTGLTRGPSSGGVVYFFDTRNGQLVYGIDTRTPFAIENLEFSPDGRVLAICQADGQGVQFYDWRQQVQLHQDVEPKDKILGADFGVNGDFALTTVDGWLRVYSAASEYKSARALQLRSGRTPMHVKFSSRADRIAVGFDGDPVVSIVDIQSMRELRSIRVEDPRQKGLHVVEWSSDDESLLVGGETDDPAYTPIYRVPLADDPSPRVVVRLARRVSDLRRLRDGSFAFSSGEPEVGVFNNSGAMIWRTGAGTVLGDSKGDEIALNSDASQLRFRSAILDREWSFDISKGTAEVVISRSRTDGVAPVPARTVIPIRLDDEQSRLWIAGRDIPLDVGERVNTWLEDETHRFVLVGSTWSLRLVDTQGNLRWRTSTPEEVIKSSITADGLVAVTFLADGTLRWIRLDDGVEFLALLPHRNGIDWVAWTPDGYYLSSPAGDSMVGWQLNNGMTATPDFYRAVQFERVFYRPDIVREHFRTLGRSTVARSNGVNLARLRDIAPPRLSIQVLGTTASGNARVRITGASTALPIKDWTLFVDGIPATPGAARTLTPAEAAGFTRELEVPLLSDNPVLRVEAFNGTSLGMEEEAVVHPSSAKPSQGRLFIAAVGVANYADPEINDLNYPPRDAEELARLYADLGKQSFSEVRVLQLTDRTELKPSAENLRKIGPFFAEATAADTVVLFLASHGFSDTAGNYYFLPQDAKYSDVETVLNGGAAGSSIVGWQFFFDLLRGTAGRRLLIVDTCSSGNIGGTFDVHSLAKRSMASSFGLLTASTGDELSQEKPSLQHGIFTYGLLQALAESARSPSRAPLLVRDAFDKAFAITQKEHVPSADNPRQTPQRSLPPQLESMALLPHRAAP